MIRNYKYSLKSFITIWFILVSCFNYAQNINRSGLLNPQIPLFGIWESEKTEEKTIISIFDTQYYSWNDQSGIYATMNDSVWFFNEDKSGGTKWYFEIKSDSLYLKKPETFQYLGSGNYIYFQIINPNQVIGFKQQFEYGQEYVTEYFENGNKKTSVIFHKQGEGIQNQWYLSGKKEVEVAFKNEKLHGKYITFSEDGTMIQTDIYENGEKLEKKSKE